MATPNDNGPPSSSRVAGGEKITRREFVVGAGAVGAGVLLAACGTESGSEPAAAPAPTDASPSPMPAPSTGDQSPEPPLKEGLAEGMYGRPTGFEGAERYQYPFDSEEGRAISALRRLRQDGVAPETLRIARGDLFNQPFPEGGSSPVQLLEDETDIRIEFLDFDLDEHANNVDRAAKRDGSVEVLNVRYMETPELVRLNLLHPLDEFVSEYRPSWLDDELGYLNAEALVNRFTQFMGTTYAVGIRNDPLVWPHQVGLIQDPAEQGAFEDRYGRELRFPLTWDEHAEVAEFLHRPNADPPLFGSVELRQSFFQTPDWCSRFVCSANPNHTYFTADGAANLNTDAGVRATEEHIRGLQWATPNALEVNLRQAADMLLDGDAFMGSGLPWITTREQDPQRRLATGLTPGRVVDDALVRRPPSWFTETFAVNAFAAEGTREAAYLVLQWLGSARVHAWASAASGEGVTPLHTYSTEDPAVIDRYGEQPMTTLVEATRRSAPVPRLREYWFALDNEISAALRGDRSAEQAMRNADQRWNALTDAGGEEQLAAISSFTGDYSTLVDEVPTGS